LSYNCVVCIKQVPARKDTVEASVGSDGALDRTGPGAVLNPDDLHALEAALMVRDEHGGTVTAITMGPPGASEVLREALYRGVDEGVLVSDPAVAGSDTYATSYVLACAIKKLGPDLVFCGRRSVDGETAQTGPQLADKLSFTLITYMSEPLEIDGVTAIVRRHLGSGSELVKADLPLLITVLGSANAPRPPSLQRVMKLKKARTRAEVEIEAGGKKTAARTDRECKKLKKAGLLIGSWNLKDIGADPARCGSAGSLTSVVRVQSISIVPGEYKEFKNSKKGIEKLVSALFQEKVEG
jgi:electron transfer flavoprotein beta subunit